MMNVFYCLLLSFIFLLHGCTSVTACRNDFGQDRPHTDIISSVAIAKYIDEMADGLYPKFGGGNVIVTDFVNTTSYQATPAGVIMAEILKTSISNRTNAKIVQADFAKSFRITPNGVVSLTRDIQKAMPSNLYVPIALVGTYNILNNSLYIFIKRINIRNASVVHSVSRKISFSCFGEYIMDTTQKSYPRSTQNSNIITPR